MTRHARWTPLGAVLAILLLASAAAAQSIVGRVVHDATDQVLEGVHVTLLDGDGERLAEAFTDAAGAFGLPVPRAGTWRIRAALIGFADVESQPVKVTEDERVRLEVRMDVEAVALDPVIVTSRTSSQRPAIRDFYDRVQQGRHSGLGQYVTRDEVERQSPWRPTDLLRSINGVRVVSHSRGPGSFNAVRMSRGCVPSIYVDGMQINRFGAGTAPLDEYVTASAIEGIEVYRGAGRTVSRYQDDRGCGLILVWTRRHADSAEGKPLSLGRLAAGAGVVLGLLLLR